MKVELKELIKQQISSCLTTEELYIMCIDMCSFIENQTQSRANMIFMEVYNEQ